MFPGQGLGQIRTITQSAPISFVGLLETWARKGLHLFHLYILVENKNKTITGPHACWIIELMVSLARKFSIGTGRTLRFIGVRLGYVRFDQVLSWPRTLSRLMYFLSEYACFPGSGDGRHGIFDSYFYSTWWEEICFTNRAFFMIARRFWKDLMHSREPS